MWNNLFERRLFGGVWLRKESDPVVKVQFRGAQEIGKSLLLVICSGVLGVTDSLPMSIDLGVDKRKLNVARRATGNKNIKTWISKTASVAVRYTRTQDRVCVVG